MSNAQTNEDVVYLVNAFSLNMLSKDEVTINAIKVNAEEVKRFIVNKKVVSFIGHSATSQALSILLGIPVDVNRSMLKITQGEMIVFTLNQRLNEGQVITSQEELNKIGYSLWYVNVR